MACGNSAGGSEGAARNVRSCDGLFELFVERCVRIGESTLVSSVIQDYTGFQPWPPMQFYMQGVYRACSRATLVIQLGAGCMGKCTPRKHRGPCSPAPPPPSPKP